MFENYIKLKKVIYKNYYIYYFLDKYAELSKNIIDKKVKTELILKETKRNYVSIISDNNEKYVFKEPRNEYRIIQRKIMTFFKKGEVLSTLININKLIDYNKINNYSRPLAAIVQRKNGMINYSALVMENITEDKQEEKDIKKIIELMEKIHHLGFYHGDFNLSNFLVDENKNIRIIDTQGKKMIFGNYRAHYDMLTMKMDTYRNMVYPYKKNIFYYMALGLKKVKRLSFVKKIKEIRKNLRNKKK